MGESKVLAMLDPASIMAQSLLQQRGLHPDDAAQRRG